MIQVALPQHLRTLARVDDDVSLDVRGAITAASVLDALEHTYPMLQGTIRDHVTKERRPFLRYFACGADISFDAPDRPLPDAIVHGTEPFLVIGAISGG